MSKNLKQQLPQYVSSTVFFQSVGVHFALGSRLVELGILEPVAYYNDSQSLFPATPEAVVQAKAAVVAHRLATRRALQNVKELCRV